MSNYFKPLPRTTTWSHLTIEEANIIKKNEYYRNKLAESCKRKNSQRKSPPSCKKEKENEGYP